METDKNYFLVGIFVITVIVAALSFTVWLTSTSKGQMADYHVRFSEPVGNLKVGSAVKFQGVDVGNVKKIAIDPDDIRLILADISILKTTPVKTDTTATMKLKGVSGDIYIDLNPGSIDAPNLRAIKADEIPEIHAEKSSINAIIDRMPELLEKTDHLLAKADHIANQLDKIFSDQNVRMVNGVIKKFGANYGDVEEKENRK